MTIAEFQAKYNNASTGLFKDNSTREISEEDLRELVADICSLTDLPLGGNFWPLQGSTTLIDDVTIGGDSYNLIINDFNIVGITGADVAVSGNSISIQSDIDTGINITNNSIVIVDGDGGQINITGGIVSISGTIANSALSPSQITSNTNNYSPTKAGFYRLSTDASRNITGWVPVTDGQYLEIHNVGSFDIVFTHNDTGNSTAANCFRIPGGGSLTLGPDQCATWRYDGVTDRWRLIGYTG